MYIAKDMVPTYTVEKPGFINMIQVFDPGMCYKPKYLSEGALPQLYNSTRQRVAKELEEVSSRTMQTYMLLIYQSTNSKMFNLCLKKKNVCHVTFYVVTFSLFTMAGPAILFFWLAVPDCTLTPKGGKTKFKKVHFLEEFLCHLHINGGGGGRKSI